MPLFSSIRFAALLCAAFVLSLAATDAAEAKKLAFHSERLGAVEQYKPFLVIRVSSQDGCHLALLNQGNTADTMSVILDGKKGPEFDGILSRTPVFSPDGRRTVYGARKGERWTVVEVDKGDPMGGLWWDRILENSFSFSSNGKHLAYVAKNGNSWYVVVDGNVSEPYDEISSLPLFSKEGNEMAYGAQKNGKQFVIRNGEPGPEFNVVGAVTLSPDGKRIAYGVQHDGRQFAMIDGEPSARYGGIYGETLQFSPDSKHVAYAVEKGPRRFVVIDGNEGPDFDGIARGSLRISPDSRRVAYAARKGEKWVAVVDDQAGREYAKLETPIFSENSQHVAYVAGDESGRFLVVDGKAGTEYEQVLKETVVFSSTGEFVAYAAVLPSKKTGIIVNDKVLGEYDSVGAPSFSPDGRHVTYRASVGDNLSVYVDGQVVTENIALVCEPVYRHDGVLEYMATEKGMLFRVTSLPSEKPASESKP